MNKDVKEIMESYKKLRGTVPLYVEMLAERKPDVLKAFNDLRNKIYEEELIPRKYRELILMAMCFARLYPIGGEGHMKLALEAGATKEEVFEVMMLMILGNGIPPFSTSVRSLDSLENKQE